MAIRALFRSRATPASRDPRSIVTPDAFSVAPELLGLQLARSWRRLAALTLDGLLIVFLQQVLDWRVLLGLTTIFFLAALARRPLGSGPAWRRRAVVGGAVVVAVPLVVFVMVLPTLMQRYAATLEDGTEPIQVVADTVADTLSATAQSPVEAESPAEPESPAEIQAAPISDWMRDAADQAGLVFGWGTVYMTLFLALWKGRTPGKRAFGLQVLRLNGRPLGLVAAFERTGGYAAGTATGLLGFARVWWDPNRQAIHDKIADTVVVRERLPRVQRLWGEAASGYVSGPSRVRPEATGGTEAHAAAHGTATEGAQQGDEESTPGEAGPGREHESRAASAVAGPAGGDGLDARDADGTGDDSAGVRTRRRRRRRRRRQRGN